MIEHWLGGEHGEVRCSMATHQHGLPLLLIHGYGGLIEHWQRVIPLLAAAHTPCAFDLYNFGYSARLSVPPRKEIWATQAAHVIEHLLHAPAVVVGHSMGGMVAAQLARDYPHLVRGLVLVNSAGLLPERLTMPVEQTLFGVSVAPGLGEMLAGISQMTGSWAIYQSLLASYFRKDRVTADLVEAFSGPLRKPGGIDGYLAVAREFKNLVLDFAPGDVQTPTLIVWGAADYAMPPAMAVAFKEKMLPQAEIEIVSGTGHCPFDEAPEAFCEVVFPWLARL